MNPTSSGLPPNQKLVGTSEFSPTERASRDYQRSPRLLLSKHLRMPLKPGARGSYRLAYLHEVKSSSLFLSLRPHMSHESETRGSRRPGRPQKPGHCQLMQQNGDSVRVESVEMSQYFFVATRRAAV